MQMTIYQREDITVYEVRSLSHSASKRLLYAGSTFIFYAVFTGITPTNFFVAIPVPIELLRAIAALLITYFISNALNIFDIESRIKIEQQSRRLVQVEKLTSLGQLAAGSRAARHDPEQVRQRHPGQCAGR